MGLRGGHCFVYCAAMNRGASNIEEPRRETAAALIVSILLHVFLILGAWYFLLHGPQQAPPPMPEDTEPVRLTILPPAPAATPKPQFIANPPTEKLDRKPSKDAAFESDNDSLAASEAPAIGEDPVPSQEGRDEPGIEFLNQQHTIGKTAAPALPAQNQAAASESPAEPLATPEPRTDLALLELPKPTPAKKTSEQNATQPREKQAAPSSYRPETRVTRLKGNISNRGRASVEANATPLGRYKKMVSDAIGSRWYYHVNSQMGLLNIGTVEITFTVTPEGKVKAPRVISNTSNESFASVSIAAIVQAEIPPIPPEVAKILENGRLQIDYSFTILGN
jgi:hypothetical protein